MGLKRRDSGFRRWALLVAIFTLMVPVAVANAAQEDLAKKYADIIGEYEFDMEGQVMVVKFWIEDGKLWGGPDGDEPGELTPVEGQPLKFEINTADGQVIELEFVKDDSGKVVKCLALAMGMELEGLKIIK